jgi:hypothetical protein
VPWVVGGTVALTGGSVKEVDGFGGLGTAVVEPTGPLLVGTEVCESVTGRSSVWASTLASGLTSIGRGRPGPGPSPPVRAKPAPTMRPPATAMTARIVRLLRGDQASVADAGGGSWKAPATMSSGRLRVGGEPSAASSGTSSFCAKPDRLPMARPGRLGMGKSD